jgi:hypothetical protein
MSTRAKDSRPRRRKLPKLSVRGQGDRGRLPTDAVVAVWRNNNLRHQQEVRLRMRQLEQLNLLTDKRRHECLGSHLFERYRAYIQRRDSIMAWGVILSVHGADPIAEAKLWISPFLR